MSKVKYTHPQFSDGVMNKEEAVTFKKDHNYYAEYQHEVAKNDKLSNLLQKLDRENERLSDKLEELKSKVKEMLYDVSCYNGHNFQNICKGLEKLVGEKDE